MKVKIQFKFKREEDGRIRLTAAVGEDTYHGYISDADYITYFQMLDAWGSPEGVHSLSSPQIEIELEEKS